MRVLQKQHSFLFGLSWTVVLGFYSRLHPYGCIHTITYWDSLILWSESPVSESRNVFSDFGIKKSYSKQCPEHGIGWQLLMSLHSEPQLAIQRSSAGHMGSHKRNSVVKHSVILWCQSWACTNHTKISTSENVKKKLTMEISFLLLYSTLGDHRREKILNNVL